MISKQELAQKMQEIDQQLAATKRQIKTDNYELQASHDLFDMIAEESLIQMAELKGEKIQNKKELPIIMQAQLINDDSSDEDW